MKGTTLVALLGVGIVGLCVLLLAAAPLLPSSVRDAEVQISPPSTRLISEPTIAIDEPPTAPSKFKVLLPWDRRSALKLTNLPTNGDCGGGVSLVYRSKEGAPEPVHGVIFDSIGVMRRDEAIANLSQTVPYKVGLWNTENWRGRAREWSSKYRVRWLNKTDSPQWWGRFDAVASFESTSQIVIPYAANPLFARLDVMRVNVPALPQLGLAMHVASNCHTDFGATFRTSYLGLPPVPSHLAGKMPKHRSEMVNALTTAGISVGNYGLCGSKGNDLSDHCRDGPKDLKKYCVMRRYTFYLALENSRFPDYVTEKVLEPLAVGVIPVYLGAPNVADYLPADHMIVDASAFASVSELASYLQCVSANHTLVAYYQSWRQRVVNGSDASLHDVIRRRAVPICDLAASLRSGARRGFAPPTPPSPNRPPLTDQHPIPCTMQPYIL